MKLLSLNHYWRICAAGLSYVLFAIGAFLPAVYIFSLALFPIDKASKQRKVRDCIQWLCRVYVNIMQFLGLMKYSLQDQHPLAVSGHMVISNHTMLIDALFCLAYVENLCCVVKNELYYNPFTRLPVRLAGYIANDDPDLVGQTAKKLKAGENILIFPEGTRNHHDLQLEFRRGASNIAVASGAPILPIVLLCMPRALGKGQSWWQLPDVKSRIVMKFRPILKLSDCIDVSQPRTLQYRQLNQWLRHYYETEIKQVLKDNVGMSR